MLGVPLFSGQSGVCVLGSGLRPFLTGLRKSPHCRRCLPNNFHTASVPGCPCARIPDAAAAPRCAGTGKAAPAAAAANSGLIGMQGELLLHPIAIQCITTLTCAFLIALTSNLTMTKSFSAILNFIILICQA